MYKVSVIVPVYNVEKYLNKCIESIIKQSYENIEIILVDDGSTDKSGKICDEYSLKDSRIKVIHKENGGLSDARNYGIDAATGDYLLFVDSDDYIDIDLIKNVNQYMNKQIDVIKFKMVKIDDNGKEIEKIDGPVFDELTGEEAFSTLVFNDYLLECACIYLFKRELIINNNFKFAVGAEHEDFGLTPLVIISAKNMASVNNYGYYYVQSDNSITRNSDYNRTLKRFNDSLMHYDNMIQFLKNHNISNETKRNIKTYYTNSIILKLLELNKQDRKIYASKIKSRKMIKNIQVHNIKQFIKKLILIINIEWYLKLK